VGDAEAGDGREESGQIDLLIIIYASGLLIRAEWRKLRVEHVF
jgi:hypothetical protein